MSAISNTNAFKPTYLIENNPEKNLEILSSFTLSPESKICVMTKGVSTQIPRWHVSKKTIREWTISAAVTTVLGGVVSPMSLGIGFCCYSRYNGSILKTFSGCVSDQVQAFHSGQAQMIGVLYASMVGLTAIGLYTGLNVLLGDRKQQKRFEALDKEYSDLSTRLMMEYDQAVQNNKTDKMKLLEERAKKLNFNLPLINAHLKNSVYLTETQAHLLSLKVKTVVDRVIDHTKQTNTAPKEPTGVRS